MSVEPINPDGMCSHRGSSCPPTPARCSSADRTGVDENGEVVARDLAGQTVKAVDNLIKVLEAAGGTLDDLVRVGLYVKGDQDIGPGFAAWMARAGQIKRPPTVSAVRGLGLVNPDFLIEIDAMAVLR